MEQYPLEDKYSEEKNDGDYLLNEKSSELLQQKECSNIMMFETAITQEQFLVKEGDEIQYEERIYEATVETVEHCNYQTNKLCINAGIISDDEVLMKRHGELELLEYLLENSEYDSLIANEGVHYSGQEQKDIIDANGVEERFAYSFESPLENSLKRLNQHTDVLIEEEKSEQHIEVLLEEEEALGPYIFDFNNCFVSAGLVAGAGGNWHRWTVKQKWKKKILWNNLIHGTKMFNCWRECWKVKIQCLQR